MSRYQWDLVLTARQGCADQANVDTRAGLLRPVPIISRARWSGVCRSCPFLAMPEDRRRAFVGSVLERLSSRMYDGGLAVPQQDHYLTAIKPAQPECRSCPGVGEGA